MDQEDVIMRDIIDNEIINIKYNDKNIKIPYKYIIESNVLKKMIEDFSIEDLQKDGIEIKNECITEEAMRFFIEKWMPEYEKLNIMDISEFEKNYLEKMRELFFGNYNIREEPIDDFYTDEEHKKDKLMLALYKFSSYLDIKHLNYLVQKQFATILKKCGCSCITPQSRQNIERRFRFTDIQYDMLDEKRPSPEEAAAFDEEYKEFEQD